MEACMDEKNLKQGNMQLTGRSLSQIKTNILYRTAISWILWYLS